MQADKLGKFHFIVYESKAIVRALLIALATILWCFEQLPVLFGGRILA
jgi:hypothetical protein